MFYFELTEILQNTTLVEQARMRSFGELEFITGVFTKFSIKKINIYHYASTMTSSPIETFTKTPHYKTNYSFISTSLFPLKVNIFVVAWVGIFILLFFVICIY